MKKTKSFLLKFWPFLILLLLSFPSIWALFVPGFYGASDDMHVAWLYEMDRSIKLGQIPPRFVPDLSFAFGYPLFNFLFPLPFYLGEIFHLIGFNFVDSVKAVFGLSMFLSALAMYFLLREFTNKFLSLAGALVYLYTPYRATDLYVRGAFGELVAFAILPIIILSVLKLTETKKDFNFLWIGIGALSLGALTLTHNITIYMFFPFVLLLGILRIIFSSGQKLKIILQSFLAAFLGILISLYFWLPALLDSKIMKPDTVFNFIDHFPTLKQLATPYFGYGASVAGPYDGMSFFMGAINLLLIILALFLLIFSWKKYNLDKKIILIWSGAVLLLSVVMMNYRSTFLWENLPLLPFFQFPWRFLIMTTLVTPIFIIALENFKYKNILAIMIIILTVTLNVNNFKPHDFLGRTDIYFMNRFIPNPIAQPEYFEIQEEYLRLPLVTQYRPEKNYPLIESYDGEILEVKKNNDLNILVKTFAKDNFTLTFNKYNFPGWVALVDGKSVDIISGQPFGQITINVPKGSHEIEFKFQETTFKLVLDFISLGALLVSLFLILKPKFKS